MHDFALTPGYLVLLDVPVTFSLGAVSAGLKLPYTWNPAHQARVGRAADLVLLAAQDFTAEPVARVHLPAGIPLGFYGSWIRTSRSRRMHSSISTHRPR